MRATTHFVFGRPGTGKSTLLRALVAANVSRPDRFCRFVVWDQTAEWARVPKGAEPGQVVILPAWRHGVEQAARLALANGATLVVDEVDTVAGNRGGGQIPGTYLPTIVYRGRHYGAALVCATQRPGRVHPSIFAHAGTIFAFRLTLARDLERVAHELGREVAEKVAALDGHAYLRLDQ